MLVDYNEIEGMPGIINNFHCVLADWGTARVEYGINFFGGTPMYAGPRSFEGDHKDVFSFGRLALELFLDQQGFGHEIKRNLLLADSIIFF